MQKLVLSAFINKAIQISNRRLVPSDFIGEAITVFDDPALRNELVKNANMKKEDLIFNDNFIKKGIKINGKEHKALSLKIQIITPPKFKTDGKPLNYSISASPKSINKCIQIQYILLIHYGNGKISNSQTLAIFTENFEKTATELTTDQIGIQYNLNSNSPTVISFDSKGSIQSQF